MMKQSADGVGRNAATRFYKRARELRVGGKHEARQKIVDKVMKLPEELKTRRVEVGGGVYSELVKVAGVLKSMKTAGELFQRAYRESVATHEVYKTLLNVYSKNNKIAYACTFAKRMQTDRVPLSISEELSLILLSPPSANKWSHLTSLCLNNPRLTTHMYSSVLSAAPSVGQGVGLMKDCDIPPTIRSLNAMLKAVYERVKPVLKEGGVPPDCTADITKVLAAHSNIEKDRATFTLLIVISTANRTAATRYWKEMASCGWMPDAPAATAYLRCFLYEATHTPTPTLYVSAHKTYQKALYYELQESSAIFTHIIRIAVACAIPEVEVAVLVADMMRYGHSGTLALQSHLDRGKYSLCVTASERIKRGTVNNVFHATSDRGR